jgi:bacterioferritin-associated ferredoxin
LSYHKAVRPFLDKLFQPGKSWLIPEKKETIVCRCEEVTVNDIRQAISMGAQSPDRIKSLVRCGMGPCQARMCGLTVSEILADARNISPEEVGYLKIRSPIKPITLGKLAEID